MVVELAIILPVNVVLSVKLTLPKNDVDAVEFVIPLLRK